MVVDNHPTLLNVTLHPSKVGASKNIQLNLWQLPWLSMIKHRNNVLKISDQNKEDDEITGIFFDQISHANTLFLSFNCHLLLVILNIIYIKNFTSFSNMALFEKLQLLQIL